MLRVAELQCDQPSYISIEHVQTSRCIKTKPGATQLRTACSELIGYHEKIPATLQFAISVWRSPGQYSCQFGGSHCSLQFQFGGPQGSIYFSLKAATAVSMSV